jgi:hypothetical protein
MKFNLILATLITTLTLSGCAKEHSQSPKSSVSFVTNIEKDGRKLFSFNMTAEKPQDNQRRKNRKGERRGNRPNRSARKERRVDNNDRQSTMQERAYTALEKKLNELDYCREGYFELDSYFYRGQTQIWGECHDAATEKDRQKFAHSAEH